MGFVTIQENKATFPPSETVSIFTGGTFSFKDAGL